MPNATTSDLAVFIARRDVTCGECGEALGRHAWITLDRERGAAVVSMTSITYGRLGLSAARHPGNTVSCTQAEALVLAAERRTRRRPWRRTDLLAQRICDIQSVRAELAEKVTAAQDRLVQAQAALTEVQQRVADGQQ